MSTASTNNVAKNIQALVEHEGMSLDAWGRKFGVKKGLVSIYTRGGSEPKIQKVMEICEYYGISLDDFYLGDLYSVNLEQTRAKAVMGPEEDVDASLRKMIGYANPSVDVELEKDYSEMSKEDLIEEINKYKNLFIKANKKVSALLDTIEGL